VRILTAHTRQARTDSLAPLDGRWLEALCAEKKDEK
jgi:hypothetical protein